MPDHRDSSIEIVTRGRALANVWSGPPTVEAIKTLREHQRELVTRLGGQGRHVVLSAFHASVGLRVEDDARREASALADEMREHVIAIGQVVLGRGFFAAVARSVLSGVQLITRPPYPMPVFSELREGEQFLARALASEFPESGDDVALALATLRTL